MTSTKLSAHLYVPTVFYGLRKGRSAVAASLALSAVLTLGSSSAQAQSGYPVTLNNCGVDLTFDQAPSSVVSIGQASTEILYSLGLADKVSGTALWFSKTLPEFTDINDKVERVADNNPSFEAVVAKRPGLVTAQYEWSVGPQGVVGTREQFADLSIPTYVMPVDCLNKDNTAGSDGTRTAMYTMDGVYQGVRELAAIFGTPETGESVVADLEAREAAAIAKAQELDLGDASAVFWFSSAEMDIDPYVAGRKGPPGFMMEALGLRNIIESDEEWPIVGWETIAHANPTVIVIAQMDRRRFPADDVEKKLEFLRTDPVASQMEAVKAGRIVIMDAHSMDPSIRNINGLEYLADALAGFDLK